MHGLMLSAFILTVILTPVVGRSQGGELSQRIAELSDKLAFATEGRVLSLQEDTVYIDLGQKDGIIEGNRFELVRLGQPLMVGSRVLGYEEKIIGEVEILRVRKDLSIAKVVTKEAEIQKGDKVYQLKKKVHRVAVGEFPYGDALNDFTRNLQDLLYTHLIQKGMNVVEREKLEQVLREQKIAYSGMIDLGTAAQLGKILGVEGILVGSVMDVGNLVAITARLVDVEKGTAITAARVELAKTADVTALLDRGSRPLGSREGTVAEAQPVAKPQGSIVVEAQKTPKTTGPRAPTEAEKRLAKPLKVTTAALTKRATEGQFAGFRGGTRPQKA